MSWTDETDARLRELWDTRLSASAIGGVLGVSRNAVLGRVHRLKLPARRGAPGVKMPRARRQAAGDQQRRSHFGQPSGPGVLRRAAARAAAPPSPALPAHLPRDAGEDERPGADRARVALVDLLGHQCKWPVGDPRDPGFGFCGLPRDGEKSPYCAAHRARATRVEPVEGAR